MLKGMVPWVYATIDVMHMMYCRIAWYLGWFFLLDAFPGIGQIIVSGCVVRPSVAPVCGEKPWPIAPRYNLAVPFGSMMRMFPSETLLFGFISVLVWLIFAASKPLLGWFSRFFFAYSTSFSQFLSFQFFRGLRVSRHENTGLPGPHSNIETWIVTHTSSYPSVFLCSFVLTSFGIWTVCSTVMLILSYVIIYSLRFAADGTRMVTSSIVFVYVMGFNCYSIAFSLCPDGRAWCCLLSLLLYLTAASTFSPPAQVLSWVLCLLAFPKNGGAASRGVSSQSMYFFLYRYDAIQFVPCVFLGQFLL